MSDFVPVELAVELKEKGFREECYGYYTKNGNFFNICPQDINDSEYRIPSPTISQVLKWLREEKKIHVVIYPTQCNFHTDIYSHVETYYNSEAGRYLLGYRREITLTGGITWEYALGRALKFVLDKLI